MKARTTILFTVLMVAFSMPLAWSQGQGKGSQGGGSSRGGQGQQQERQGQGAGKGQGAQVQDRDRIQATDQQRDQIRSCDRSADQIRTRAGQLSKRAQGANFNVDDARQERNRLREQVATMQQEQERLMAGLDDKQRGALQQRTQNMSRLQESLRTQLQALDDELGKANPDAKQVTRQAREMERTTKELQNQYRDVQSQMVVQP